MELIVRSFVCNAENEGKREQENSASISRRRRSRRRKGLLACCIYICASWSAVFHGSRGYIRRLIEFTSSKGQASKTNLQRLQAHYTDSRTSIALDQILSVSQVVYVAISGKPSHPVASRVHVIVVVAAVDYRS